MIRFLYLLLMITYIPPWCESFPLSKLNRLSRAEALKKCSGSLDIRLQFNCSKHVGGPSSGNYDGGRGFKGSYGSSEVSDAKVVSEPAKNNPTDNESPSNGYEADNVDDNHEVDDNLSTNGDTTKVDDEEDRTNAECGANVDEDVDGKEGGGDADNANYGYEGDDAKMAEGTKDFNGGGAKLSDDSNGGSNLDFETEAGGSTLADDDDTRSQSNGAVQLIPASKTINLKCTVDTNEGDCSPDCDCSQQPTVREEPVQVFKRLDDNLSQDDESDCAELCSDGNEKNSQYLYSNSRQA